MLCLITFPVERQKTYFESSQFGGSTRELSFDHMNVVADSALETVGFCFLSGASNARFPFQFAAAALAKSRSDRGRLHRAFHFTVETRQAA
jgi:hypothetical protein